MTIVSNGQTLDINAGETSAGVVVLAGGLVDVMSGGTADGTVLSGGDQDIESGGLASGTVISGGGIEKVFGGGTASGSIVDDGGTLDITSSGIGSQAIVNSGGTLRVESGGDASGSLVSSGGAVSLFVSSGTVSGGQSVIDGVTIEAGAFVTLDVLSGASVSGYVVDGGLLRVEFGATANDLAIDNGGEVDLIASVASGVTVNSGGVLRVAQSFAIIRSGSIQVLPAAIASGTIVSNGGLAEIAGTGIDTVVKSGGVAEVTGGTTDTVVHSGGLELVDGGGVAGNTFLDGGQQDIQGEAVSATVGSGGVQLVETGGHAEQTTINAGGIAHANSGAFIDEAIVSSGGTLDIDSGGIAAGSIVSSGGTAGLVISTGATAGAPVAGQYVIDGVTIQSGGVLDLEVLAGGSTSGFVVSGGGHEDVFGTATGTVVDSGAFVEVAAGGSASHTVVNGGAWQDVSGVASGTILNAQADQFVFGTASGTVVGSGGRDHVFGIASGTIINGGDEQVIGVALGATVNSGTLEVFNGGLASGTILGAAGTESVSGGTAAGVTFQGGGGTLMLDDPADLTGTIANWRIGDTIDFRNALLSNVTIGATLSFNRLGGQTYSYALSGLQSGTSVVALADGHGGTALELVSATATRTAATLTTRVDRVTKNNVDITATNRTLSIGDMITPGSGLNVLHLSGGGTFDMRAPLSLSHVQEVDAQEGAGTLAQSIYLRAGLAVTVNVASSTVAGSFVTVYGADDADVINLGNGNDKVFLGSAAETVLAGGGNDTFHVTASTVGATIDGGTGVSTLDVEGGGSVTMGANLTRLSNVVLVSAPSGQTQPDYVFTANTIAGLAITGSNGNDTITVGNASQTVRTGAGHSTVELTADTAEALVIGGTGTTLLEIAGGGTTALNFNTTKVTVQLDAPTDLTLSAKGAVTALGSSGADAIVAQARAQTLTGGGGADTLIGFAAGSDIFRDTSAGLNGDTIGNFAAKGDIINLTDMNIATIQTLGFSQGPQSATLTVGDGTHMATIALLGQFAQAGFHYAADTTGGGGVDLTYVAPAVQHSAMLGSPV